MTIIDPVTNKFIRFNVIEDQQYGSARSLTGKINTIYQNGNDIWLATRDGIAKTKISGRGENYDFLVYRYDLNQGKEFLLNATAFLGNRGGNELRVGTETSGLFKINTDAMTCLLYTSPSPRDRTRSRMPSSA